MKVSLPLHSLGCSWGRFGASAPVPIAQVLPDGQSSLSKQGRSGSLSQKPQWHQLPQLTGWSGADAQVLPGQSALVLQGLNRGSFAQRLQSEFELQLANVSLQRPVPVVGLSENRKFPHGSFAVFETLPVVTLLKRTARPTPEILADRLGAQLNETPPKSLVVASTRQLAPGV